MSRSYKKTPGFKDRNPWFKNYANRRIRRTSREFANGGSYKKHTCSWEICEYKWLFYSDVEFKSHLKKAEEYPWIVKPWKYNRK